MVSQLMCCTSNEALNGVDSNAIIDDAGLSWGAVGDPNFAIYQSTAQKYLPMEFDQSKGWNGRTYVEALQFCGSMSGYEICLYNAIYPLGPDSKPMGRHKEEVKG